MGMRRDKGRQVGVAAGAVSFDSENAPRRQMSTMVTRVQPDRVVVTVTGELDASKLLEVFRLFGAASLHFIVDVKSAAEVTPLSLAMLKGCEFWPRISLWGLSYNGERLLRHLGDAPVIAAGT